MATQGQRRAEAKSAIRKLRQVYRRADTLGESFERELDRLLKRKQLIGVDQLKTLADRLYEYAQQVDQVQRMAIIVRDAIQLIPV